MEIKKSKIQKVEMLQEWSNSYGVFHPHKCTFENGDIAITNKKEVNALTVGQEIQYQITGQDNAGNNKFKEIQEEKSYSGGGKSDKVQTYIIRQSSLTRAIEHLKEKEQKDLTKENVVALAEYYTNWVLK